MASVTWQAVDSGCQLGTQLGLPAGGVSSPTSGTFQVAAGFQEGMFHDAKEEVANRLRSGAGLGSYSATSSTFYCSKGSLHPRGEEIDLTLDKEGSKEFVAVFLPPQ